MQEVSATQPPLVTAQMLADELGVSNVMALVLIRAAGVPFQRRKLPGRSGPGPIAVTPDDAERVRCWRADDQQRRVSIYALLCPDTGAVRYVGKTCWLVETRLRSHLHDSARNHRTNWIRSLLKRGKKPRLVVIEVVPGARLQPRERFWIAEMRRRGERLTNLTDGGEGVPGRIWTEEQRARMSATQRAARKQTLVPVACAHCGAALERTPTKIRHSKSGLFYCNKTCKARREKPITLWCPSPEERAARNAKASGWHHTLEARARIAADARARQREAKTGDPEALRRAGRTPPLSPQEPLRHLP
jgi:hypothetical protein